MRARRKRDKSHRKCTVARVSDISKTEHPSATELDHIEVATSSVIRAAKNGHAFPNTYTASIGMISSAVLCFRFQCIWPSHMWISIAQTGVPPWRLLWAFEPSVALRGFSASHAFQKRTSVKFVGFSGLETHITLKPAVSLTGCVKSKRCWQSRKNRFCVTEKSI